jgi:hypothetical protein
VASGNGASATLQLGEKGFHDLIGQTVHRVAHIVRGHRQVGALGSFAGGLRELDIRATRHPGLGRRRCERGRSGGGVWAGHDGCVIHTDPCVEFFLLPKTKCDTTIRIG